MAFKNDFRPDIIAGNPPYNNGADIDFVFDAFEVSRVAVSEIVPAKWQTSDAEQRIDSKHSYDMFRKDIVPHINKIIFYPEAAELFEIRNTDGITIFCVDKNKKHEMCHIINHCRHQKYFESESYRSILHRETLHNIGNEIIESLGQYNRFYFRINNNNRYEVWSGNQINGGCGWGFSNRLDPTATFNSEGAFKCTGSSIIADKFNNETDTRGASSITFTSNSLDECKNFISWFDTKLIRFLVAMNISKLGPIYTNDYFRFVPDCTDFSHKYTDKEIYEKYKISQKHIKVIESVILNR